MRGTCRKPLVVPWPVWLKHSLRKYTFLPLQTVGMETVPSQITQAPLTLQSILSSGGRFAITVHAGIAQERTAEDPPDPPLYLIARNYYVFLYLLAMPTFLFSFGNFGPMLT